MKRCRGNSSANDSAHPPSQYRLRADSDTLRSAAVTSKLEDGNIAAAVRILCSDDTPAEFSEETLAKLSEKHPACSSCVPYPISVSASHSTYQATEVEVMKMIRSFPAGSAAGSDGFRPNHLLEMVQSSDAGGALLSVTTSFVNMLLNGSCHDDFRHIFLVVG